MTMRHYMTPEDVANAPELSRSEKLSVLKEMELDAERLIVAEEENMGGGEHSSLRDIRQAIRRMEAETGGASKAH